MENELISKGLNSKTSTQNNVEKEVAKPAAAFSSKRSTEVTTSPGQLGQINSDTETDSVLKKEDVTDTISQTDAVKEEANTEAIDKIKMGSNKICIRNDLAKKSMMFSPESCQAILGMGNVELIELRKTRVQSPSCLHHVFEEFMWKIHQVQPRDDSAH